MQMLHHSLTEILLLQKKEFRSLFMQFQKNTCSAHISEVDITLYSVQWLIDLPNPWDCVFILG